VDALTGDAATQTVSFELGGVGYEIDLSAANAAALRAVLAPFIAAGRPTGVAAYQRSVTPAHRGHSGELPPRARSVPATPENL
jgi:hypothetical protein